jgi:hypothetical protein
MRRSLKAKDVAQVLEYVDAVEKIVHETRRQLLFAMEDVQCYVGWRQMNSLCKIEGLVKQVRDEIADLAPRSVLPASDMAAEIVGDWLRQQQQKKGLDESPRHEGEQGSA